MWIVRLEWNVFNAVNHKCTFSCSSNSLLDGSLTLKWVLTPFCKWPLKSWDDNDNVSVANVVWETQCGKGLVLCSFLKICMCFFFPWAMDYFNFVKVWTDCLYVFYVCYLCFLFSTFMWGIYRSTCQFNAYCLATC